MSNLHLVFADYTKAVKSLEVALAQAPTDLGRDGAIQRFEFVIELSWKLLQKVLSERKVMVFSPRNTYREAHKECLLDDPQAWLVFWDVRNLTSHTYREQLAQEVFAKLPSFLELAQQLEQKLKTAISS